MVKHQKILAVVSDAEMDLKGVHYALAAAGRMKAQVIILMTGPDNESPAGSGGGEDWKEKALRDLINSARQAGLNVSYYKASGPLEDEAPRLIREEGIGLVVLTEGDRRLERSLLQFRSGITGQVIQVKGKNKVDYL